MKIILLCITGFFLASCSNSVVDEYKKLKKDEPKKISQIVDQTKKGAKSFLEEDVFLDVDQISLKDVVQAILPRWKIKISNKLAEVKLDAVIQTSRREAIFDILRQVKAQVVFYDKIKPQPIAVIFEN